MMHRCNRLIVAAAIAGVAARAAAASTCVGDCQGRGKVEIADLIVGVTIALGLRPVADCEAFANVDGNVDVAQLVRAVNSALNGCPSTPTPSITAAAIATPTVTFTITPTNTPTITPGQPREHFVDNGDGTITDTLTALTWEKQDQARGLHDVNTRYRWAGLCSDTSEPCQPDAAAAATCAAATGGAIGCGECGGRARCDTDGFITIWEWLNQINAAQFAGHDDWRIPSVGRDGGTVELETIVDTNVPKCGSGVPCVPAAFDTECELECTVTSCSCTHPDFYWSMTSGVGVPPFAWGVFFPDGRVIGGDKAAAFPVRAVRGG
jgi:hypothetical protein